MSMSRGGSKRGGDRGDFNNQQVGPDGWAVAGNAGPPRPPPKAGDLSKFGKIASSGAPATFGPASVFSNKGKDGKKEASLSRTSSSSNMFSMLSQGADTAPEPSKGSRPPSRKASVDFSQSGVPEPAPQRRRLILQPRSKPVEETGAAADAAEEASSSSEGEDAAPEMTAAEVKKKIDEDLKEFFAVRNLEEAESYFTQLPAAHHSTLVDKLVSSALESKEADAQLVSDFFSLASEKELCSLQAFEAGFISIAEFLDDVAIDAPKAPKLMAIMIKGPSFEADHRTRIAAKSTENGHHLLS
jgi:translation initiation factor 4G